MGQNAPGRSAQPHTDTPGHACAHGKPGAGYRGALGAGAGWRLNRARAPAFRRRPACRHMATSGRRVGSARTRGSPGSPRVSGPTSRSCSCAEGSAWPPGTGSGWRERGTGEAPPAAPAGSRPGGRSGRRSGRRRGARRRGARRRLTGPAWRCRCRLSPTPNPSRGPPQSAGAAACAPSPSGGSRLEQRRETSCQPAPGQPPGRTAKGLHGRCLCGSVEQW